MEMFEHLWWWQRQRWCHGHGFAGYVHLKSCLTASDTPEAPDMWNQAATGVRRYFSRRMNMLAGWVCDYKKPQITAVDTWPTWICTYCVWSLRAIILVYLAHKFQNIFRIQTRDMHIMPINTHARLPFWYREKLRSLFWCPSWQACHSHDLPSSNM